LINKALFSIHFVDAKDRDDVESLFLLHVKST
jgi:hypothetical protein